MAASGALTRQTFSRWLRSSLRKNLSVWNAATAGSSRSSRFGGLSGVMGWSSLRRREGLPCPQLTPRESPAAAPSSADVGLEVGDRRGAINAVIQVDDVPLSASGDHTAARRLGHLLRRPGTQQLLIHVSLKDQ